MTSRHQVNIVGGGIAGLIAALELARAGVAVRVFEAGGGLGGRARTKDVDGYLLNQGPHALYIAGAFKRTLDRLGIPYSGGRVLGGRSQAILDGQLHDLPVSARTLMGDKSVRSSRQGAVRARVQGGQRRRQRRAFLRALARWPEA